MATIDVKAEIGQLVFFMTNAKALNVGTVESIDTEIFVKVRDAETGDIHVLKPEQLYDKEAALAYVDEKRKQIETIAASLEIPKAEG